jgi:adenine-specific DNA-methyltransferase
LNNEINLLKENEELKKQLKQLKKQKKFGLVWEDSNENENAIINGVEKFPFLVAKGEEFGFGNNGDKQNLLIEGDNIQSLKVLNYTHEGLIDIIYIDPPYNTGNKDFKYNDSFVDIEDGFRHSKWLSFMNKRLKLAKSLLKNDGVIFISIDDNEQHRLRMLCDEIFGELNFISTIHWHKGFGKNDTKHIRDVTEYVLVYAKNKKLLNAFKTNKDGIDQINQIIVNFYEEFEDYKGKESVLEKNIRDYYKSNSQLRGISSYNMVEKNTFRLYSSVTMEKPADPQYFYDIIHPITKKACKMPKKGWNRPETNSPNSMDKLLANNEVLFGKDETILPRRKYYLDAMEEETPSNFIYNTDQGGSELKKILNKSDFFTFPKHTSFMKHILGFIQNKEAIILDFFAGSGTTGHAIMELNKEDEGNRQFILCTNNENNICEEVTYERLRIANELNEYNESLQYLKIDIEEFNEQEDFELDLKNHLAKNMIATIKVKENNFNLINIENYLLQFENKPIFILNAINGITKAEFLKINQLINNIESNSIKIYVLSISDQLSYFNKIITEKEKTYEPLPETFLKLLKKIKRRLK